MMLRLQLAWRLRGAATLLRRHLFRRWVVLGSAMQRSTRRMMLHDDVKEASSAMMQACPVYLPILLRIIAQEQPVVACRYNSPP